MPKKTAPPEPATPVEELWNISNKSGAWLRSIGIHTYDDLVSADLLDVWIRLRSSHTQVTKLMYYALWSAVKNCHWNMIPESEKLKITQFISTLENK